MAAPLVYRKHANWLMVVAASGVFLLGMVMILASSGMPADSSWKMFVHDLGTLLSATVCLAVVWEIVGKRAFFDEIVANTGLVDSIRLSGVSGIFSKWLDIPWAKLLSDTNHIDVFVAYGISWRGALANELATFLTKSGTSVRIILPDPDDPGVMQAVACAFGKTPEEVKERVLNAKKDFVTKCSDRESNASYEIWYSSRPPLYSFYICGNVAVMTIYKHSSSQTAVLGLTVEKGGLYYEYLQRELAGFVIDGSARMADRSSARPARPGS